VERQRRSGAFSDTERSARRGTLPGGGLEEKGLASRSCLMGKAGAGKKKKKLPRAEKSEWKCASKEGKMQVPEQKAREKSGNSDPARM